MSNPFETLAEVLARIEVAILRQSNNAPQFDVLLSKAQTAELLGITMNTLDKYTKNKTIPVYGLGARIMFKRQEVLDSLIRINK